MLPAGDGDCLLLSYGSDLGGVRHIVVDGGRTGAYAFLKPLLLRIAERRQPVELLVLSHIDADHIEGLLPLASDNSSPTGVSAVWYNGFDQLSSLKPMGPKQGDRFSAAIKGRGWSLNTHFSNGVAVLPGSGMQEINLESGLKITLLSPDSRRLGLLRAEWDSWRTEEATRETERERKKAQGLQAMGARKPFPRVLDIDQLAATKETIDDEAPNGSSIAFVAEWQGQRVLLGADAHPDLLAQSIAPLAAAEGGRYRIDLCKVSHHGSAKNTTRHLLSLLDCKRFAISTNGSRHGHPDAETIAKLIKYASPGHRILYFNYRQERTTPWSQSELTTKHSYECKFPVETNGMLSISV